MSLNDVLLAAKNPDSESLTQTPRVTALSAYAGGDWKRSAFQLVNTAVPFAFMWYAMYRSLAWHYAWTLLLSVPTALFTVRLFIIQHDAGHGSFFQSKKVSDWVGFFIGILTLTPYQYWQKTHAIHHATSGNLDKRGYGDINTLTVAEYRSLSPRDRFLYRVYRHPVTMFIIGPVYQFVLKHRWPYNIPSSWRREWRSVHLTNLALAAVLLVAHATIGLKNFFLIQAPVTFISCAAGAWLFYVQHQYEDTYWEHEGKWDYFEAAIRGSSYYVLPGLLRWFTGDIGVHHIHHYNSRIPNYRLKRCFDENPEFQTARRLTFRTSLASIPLALWDE